MLVMYNISMLVFVGVAIFRMAKRPHRAVWLASLVATCVCGPAVIHAASSDIFMGMQMLAWAVFLHVPLLLGALAVILRKDRRISLAAAMLAALLEVIAVDAFLVEPHWLEVTRYQVDLGLDNPIKVAVLSDIQTDVVGDYEERIFDLVVAENPDLILFPGDFIQRENGHDAQYARLRSLAASLDPPLGAFAVRGNVDPPHWPQLFEGTKVQTLSNERRDVGPIEVFGLDLPTSFRGMSIPHSTKPQLVFGHGPDFALQPGGDLLVAGHTHGGQVRLPGIGPLITFSKVPRSWAAGKTDLDDGRTLIVSRGIGMERLDAPRLRFLCRPELVFLELR
jgi:uncharacterized protein